MVEIKPGTVMLAVPSTGVDRPFCFVCGGPNSHDREEAQEAFVIGMCAGIHIMTSEEGFRPPLCVEHETRFREVLAAMVAPDAALCKKLGIECQVVGP